MQTAWMEGVKVHVDCIIEPIINVSVPFTIGVLLVAAHS